MSYAKPAIQQEVAHDDIVKHYTKNTIEAFNDKIFTIQGQTPTGKTISILPTMKQKYIDTQLKTNLLYYIKKEWNCHICQERVKRMFRSLDKNLKSFICKDLKSIDKNTAEIYTSIGLTQDSIRKNYIQSTNGKEWDFTIVVKNTLYSNLLYQGADNHGNKYVHYAYTPNAYTDPSIHKKQLESISNAFHKYFPLFYGMYEKLDITQDTLPQVDLIFI